jgi:hypothetical protein
MTFDEHGHILISPRELQGWASSDPDWLINHVLLPGTPMGFPTYRQYAKFIDYLAAETGIHPHHFLFRGSTKIGYSISPNRKKKEKVKVWRRFGPGSDLDLAITDPHFYATVDEDVRRWDRLPENLEQVFRFGTGRELDKYRDRVDQKGRHDCYRFFDLPPRLACLTKLDMVMKGAPIEECCVHPFVSFKAFIFRDRWAIHRRYQTDLDDLRRGLTAKSRPLRQAPDEPFPAETA